MEGASSTSTPAPASTSTEKLRVRRRADPLTATRVQHAGLIELVGGGRVRVSVGDWILTRGQSIVDWTPSSAFDTQYESLVDHELRLSPALVARLEQTLGLGSGRDPAVLVEAVERLAAISIGTVRVDFTPGQLEEIKHRAGKRGHTVEQELRAAVDRVKDEIFHRS